MKKMFTTIALTLFAACAFAMPAPSQIEDALAARDYQSAQSMVSEVLREKPDSAKAHLFNSYIMLKQGNKQGAAAELATARTLDRGGKVQNSALFGRTVAELEAAKPAPVAQRQAVFSKPAQAQPVVQEESHFIRNLLILIGVLLLVYALYRCFKDDEPVTIRRTYEPSPPSGTRSRPPYRRDTPADVPSSYGMYGSGVVGGPSHHTTVVQDNGTNNMLTGMMMGQMMSNNSHHHHNDYYSPGGGGYVAPAPAPAPVYQAPAPSVDYASSRSSYSSGSDDSWSSKSSDSYSSSSSSSWDSGSSSSDSGGGSWD